MIRFVLLLLLAALPASADVLATYRSAGDRESAHLVPLPALHLEAGTPPTPFLEPGPFTVTWRGRLAVPKRLRLYFSFEGEGKASLKINGEETLAEEGALGQGKSERLRLNAGEHEVEITYQSREDGAARFRLRWEERSFPVEPVPPTAWLPPEGATVSRADLGRAALASHRCVRCHLPDQPFTDSAMPEVHASGPNLAGIGSRVTEHWLARWIAEPDKLKPTTTMPAMVDHRTAEGAQQAADLAAYLSTLTGGPAEGQGEPSKEDLQKGGEHFHHLGCVACHTLPGNDIPDTELGRVPLNNLATKFHPGALARFLKNPRAHNPWIKMPHFQLSDGEARTLAAYLRHESTGRHTPDPSEFPPGNAEAGRALAASLNCAACHEGLPASTAAPAPKLGDLLKLEDWSSRGCLAEEEQRGRAPRLLLDKETAGAVQDFARRHLDSLHRTTPSHYALRQMEALDCRACHKDHGQPSQLATLHTQSQALVAHLAAGEHSVDQSRPQLTFMGEMLNASYLERMLRGEVDPRPRPWLHMRMPAFPQHATPLARGMAQLHGLAPGRPDDSPRDEEAAVIGKQIVGLQGLACVTCHGAGGMKPLAAFEVVGINFAQVHERLQPEYFYRWLRDPHRITPDSKMPRYTTEDGGALRQDILDGDAQKQFEAIWDYLKAGPKVEKP